MVSRKLSFSIRLLSASFDLATVGEIYKIYIFFLYKTFHLQFYTVGVYKLLFGAQIPADMFKDSL